MRILSAIGMACFALLFVTCKKTDYCPDPPKKDSTCELVQSFLFLDSLSGDEPGLFSQYRKEFDGSGKVRKVVAGIFELRLADSVSMLLKYSGNTVYFLDEKNPGDTFTTATFDAQNRLQKMTEGNATHPKRGFNDFVTTEFYYDNNRLSSFYIVYTGNPTRLTYDANGNVVRMYNNGDQAEAGTFFTYDLSVTAKRQFYTDHFVNGGENALYLAQFMGWLPDLEPVNRRTAWKIVYNDEDPNDGIPPYELAAGSESGHVYDGNGNLIRYNNGAYTNIWRCTAEAGSPN